MDYRIDQMVFKKRVIAKGYRSLSDFAAKNNIHRNTLLNLKQGQSVFSSSYRNITNALEIDPLELMVPISTCPFNNENLDEIRPLIAHLVKLAPGKAIMLIGSQASGKAKKYSDWDIGIFDHVHPLSGREYLHLKGKVEDLSENLVRMVDLVNLNQAPSWFLESLVSTKPVFLDGNREAYIYFMGVLNGIQKQQSEKIA
jgi:predicted nucleotidyltransferase